MAASKVGDKKTETKDESSESNDDFDDYKEKVGTIEVKRNSQIHQGNENILEAEKEAESKIARDEFELEKNEEMKADEENIGTEKESKNMN